eukprot:4236294-Karenia_brevis.AAC.1
MKCSSQFFVSKMFSTLDDSKCNPKMLNDDLKHDFGICVPTDSTSGHPVYPIPAQKPYLQDSHPPSSALAFAAAAGSLAASSSFSPIPGPGDFRLRLTKLFSNPSSQTALPASPAAAAEKKNALLEYGLLALMSGVPILSGPGRR